MAVRVCILCVCYLNFVTRKDRLSDLEINSLRDLCKSIPRISWGRQFVSNIVGRFIHIKLRIQSKWHLRIKNHDYTGMEDCMKLLFST